MLNEDAITSTPKRNRNKGNWQRNQSKRTGNQVTFVDQNTFLTINFLLFIYLFMII